MSQRFPSMALAAALALASTSALAASTLPPPDAGHRLENRHPGIQDRAGRHPRHQRLSDRRAHAHRARRLQRPHPVAAAGLDAGQRAHAGPAVGRHRRRAQEILHEGPAGHRRGEGSGEPEGDGRWRRDPAWRLPALGHTTLLQAVSLAKGPDPKLANIRRVAIFRTIGGTRKSAFYDLAQVRTGKAEDPEVYGNDIIVVDTSGSKSFFQNFSGGFGLLWLLLHPY